MKHSAEIKGSGAVLARPQPDSKRLLRLSAWLTVLVGVGLIARGPLLTWYYVHKAKVAEERRGWTVAADWLESAVKASPSNAQIRLKLARMYRRLGRYEEMDRQLRLASEAGLSQERVILEQRLALAQAGQLVDVERYLAGLLAEPHEDAEEVSEALVNGYCINLNFEQAQSLLTAWEADFPNTPEIHVRRGFIDESLRDWAGAVEHYRRALEAAPYRTDARLHLALCLTELGSAEQAEVEFRRCLEEWPSSTEALLGLGAALIERKSFDEARRTYRRVLRQDKSNLEARRGLGRIALLEKQPREALEWLEPLAVERPYDANTRYLLAQACREAGDVTAAQEHFRLLAEFEEPRRRLTELFDLVPANPDDLELRFELGKLLLMHESPQGGAAYLESVLRVQPHHREARRLLADYYTQQGDERRASEHRRILADAGG